ncbi:cell division protein FtsQ/DivIB [Bacteroides sp. 519]|uniref:cell division protein FtsQ/DivIB n=1 Tax=Bacteroides sp. 519 TaxID=2302937 RepID=UPI0013D57ABB|nr:cell division protein FtsQ/DivIB [Bacteroides sp. 519]NDV57327.1 cell division protein FtsQ [Bacteroides sp. 519]
MTKKIFFLIAILCIMVYLVIAITAFNVQPANQVCKDIELIMKDSIQSGFITKKEITTLLQKDNLYPVGKSMEIVVCKAIEDNLEKHPLIDEIECYKTPDGNVAIEIKQRVPMLRVMNNKGENYYVDNKGKVMPPEARYIAHLAVATGNVDKAFATNELYQFAGFLHDNKFWNAQIEQINVLSTKEIELVPRVGDHIVFLGKIDNFEDKLQRLKEFYKKGLNKVGWNKYKRISLEFNNQIICTKK